MVSEWDNMPRRWGTIWGARRNMTIWQLKMLSDLMKQIYKSN